MQIEKKDIREVGTCNFCDRGLIDDTGLRLTFPYTTVNVLNGKSIEVRLCDDCLKKLKQIL